MGPVGIILVNPPITTFQQSLTHSAMWEMWKGNYGRTHVEEASAQYRR